MKAVLIVSVLTLAVAGCGSVTPGNDRPIASAGSGDPAMQKDELEKKGVKGGSPTPKPLDEPKKHIEAREFTVNPLDSGSTFQLVRYFLAPEEWQLLKVTYNRDGTRTYKFQRIVSSDRTPEVDPLKPPPDRTKPK